MIFVTVGTYKKGFIRLIMKMDEIAGNIDEKVIMQIGHTKYIPKNAEYFDFKNELNIQEFYQNARVVVCHAGAGSIITGMRYGKPVIVVPRQKKYDEVDYDHQADLAIELEKKGEIIVAWDVDNLEKALIDASKTPVKFQHDRRLVDALREYINILT